MKEAVADILSARARDTGGVNRMMSVSLAVHVGLVAVLVLVPRDWLFARPAPRNVMTISLGGTFGPKSTGIAPIGARSVEKAAPEPKRPEAVKPVAPKKDVMTVPVKAKPKPEYKVEEIPMPTPKPSQPTTGQTVTQGTSRVETGAKGQGTGLSMGGGAGETAFQLPTDFCCMAYASEVKDAIERNWLDKSRPERGETIMQFTIQADGTITGIKVEKSSGLFTLDQASRAALMGGLMFKPLPTEYKAPTLTIHLKFPYGIK